MTTNFASRAGHKLQSALTEFNLDITNFVCADLGCSTGGFTDCLLAFGAAKIYAVDTGYGVLDYKLRTDPRVIVMEKTNALHLSLPEKVDLVTIDVGWTPQRLILPRAKSLLQPKGKIISLIKPHYEAKKAHLSKEESLQIFEKTKQEITRLKFQILNYVQSPLVGEKAGNIEYLALVV